MDFSKIQSDFRKEIVREGTVFLDGQLRVATSADARSSGLAGIFTENFFDRRGRNCNFQLGRPRALIATSYDPGRCLCGDLLLNSSSSVYCCNSTGQLLASGSGARKLVLRHSARQNAR